MKLYRMWFLCCAGLLVSGFGCGQTDSQRYFLLEVQREGQRQSSSQDVILAVRPFSLSPGYHPKEFTYRTGEFQYESDYYHRFITDAGSQIAEQTRQWLRDSGLFAAVIEPGSTMNATHLLEGNITGLYGDFRDPDNAQAVVRMVFYLLDVTHRNPTLVFHKTFQVTTAVSDGQVEQLIEAYNESLKCILRDLEKAIVQSFQSAGNTAGN